MRSISTPCGSGRPSACSPPRDLKAAVEQFVAASRKLNGREVRERPLWNTLVSQDAIRHFAYGTSDDNPLWLDPAYAAHSAAGGLLAPPGFVCSVLYPFLHGAPLDVPLASLIGEISVEWFHPLRAGDELAAVARQTDVVHSSDRRGRSLVLIPAETVYTNQRGDRVALARGTMVRIAREEGDLLLDREPGGYTEAQRQAIRRALEQEVRAGAASPCGSEIQVGMVLPTCVRGPLSIGDLICWQAGIGPSYRAGSLGYFDTLDSPHTTAFNPVTGWPLKYSQQHEDFLMAAQRGMSAPFDNSLMRFAWLAPMITDWMGDAGFLKKLTVQTGAPLLYGDTTWYRGIVIGKAAAEPHRTEVSIRIAGVNQLGETTTTGSAVVLLPATVPRPRPPRPPPRFPAATGAPNVFERFTGMVHQRPQVPAVVSTHGTLTYAELAALSEQMAHQLVGAGATPGDIIGVLFPRTPQAIAAILAILRVGAAYLPLEASVGPERLRAVLSVASPAFTLSTREGAIAHQALAGLTQLVAWDPTTAPSAPLPPLKLNPAGLAYVMPTSGSLGAQRCVAVTHGALGLYLQALHERFAVGPADRCLQSASFNFSASVRQLFGCLAAGATLVLADEELRADLKRLLEFIKETGVTIWDTVPSVWQAAVDTLELLPEAGRRALLQHQVRMILLTGESLRWKTARQWRSLAGPSARIFNLYSQTETAGTACAYELPMEHGEDAATVPLGFPLAHCEVSLLRAEDDPADVGEICVSGPRLALGYLGEPERTAERFVLTPFQHEGTYRTGDQARRREDGALEFAGRLDLRLKIRGQRVELGEIESALRLHPSVADSAVGSFTGADGALRLVACVVPRPDHVMPEAGALLEHLRAHVTEAALPARFITLAALPRTASGKLDRAALPAPEQVDHGPPGDDAGVLSSVRQIFLESLELARLGDEDNFFEHGGNSLMATRVVSALSARFAVDLAMPAFFDNPTIQGVTLAIHDTMLREIEAMSDEEAGKLLGEATDVE